MKKKVVFGDKNSDLCLLHKIKSFDLKKVSDLFLRTKKKWFLITEKKKSDLFFIRVKRMKKKFSFFFKKRVSLII